MSGPVVFIGYILLIPSVIGMVVCGFFIIMDLSTVRSSDIGMVYEHRVSFDWRRVLRRRATGLATRNEEEGLAMQRL
jgi:hypothetical protein